MEFWVWGRAGPHVVTIHIFGWLVEKGLVLAVGCRFRFMKALTCACASRSLIVLVWKQCIQSTVVGVTIKIHGH